jgi:hypothetical protein
MKTKIVVMEAKLKGGFIYRPTPQSQKLIDEFMSEQSMAEESAAESTEEFSDE